MRRPSKPKDGRDWQAIFRNTNTQGSERFGTLWLAATSEMVSMFRGAGFGDQLEEDYQLRAAIARGLYRTLCAAILHPNNLARASMLIAQARKTANHRPDDPLGPWAAHHDSGCRECAQKENA